MSDGDDLPLYPLRLGDVLSGQEWIEMRFHRVLGSNWRTVMKRHPEAGFYGFTLWLESFRQNPAGTLPEDDEALCDLAGLGMDVARWRGLREHALYGWRPCEVADGDGGDVVRRLRHRTIEQIALRSFDYQIQRSARSGDGAQAKRVSRVMAKLPGTGLRRAAVTRGFAERVEVWLEGRRLRINDANVKLAVEDLSKGNVTHMSDFKPE